MVHIAWSTHQGVPYNVDSLEEYEQMLQMEVDGLITSDPAMVRSLSAG